VCVDTDIDFRVDYSTCNINGAFGDKLDKKVKKNAANNGLVYKIRDVTQRFPCVWVTLTPFARKSAKKDCNASVGQLRDKK